MGGNTNGRRFICALLVAVMLLPSLTFGGPIWRAIRRARCNAAQRIMQKNYAAYSYESASIAPAPEPPQGNYYTPGVTITHSAQNCVDGTCYTTRTANGSYTLQPVSIYQAPAPAPINEPEAVAAPKVEHECKCGCDCKNCDCQKELESPIPPTQPNGYPQAEPPTP